MVKANPARTPHHTTLVSVLTQDDERLHCKGDRSLARLSLYLRALACAEDDPNGLEAGILANFTHTRMRDRMLRAIGSTPCQCSRANSCRMCR